MRFPTSLMRAVRVPVHELNEFASPGCATMPLSTELCGQIAEYSGLLDGGERAPSGPIRSYGPHYASIQSTVKKSLLSFTDTAMKAAFSRR